VDPPAEPLAVAEEPESESETVPVPEHEESPPESSEHLHQEATEVQIPDSEKGEEADLREKEPEVPVSEDSTPVQSDEPVEEMHLEESAPNEESHELEETAETEKAEESHVEALPEQEQEPTKDEEPDSSHEIDPEEHVAEVTEQPEPVTGVLPNEESFEQAQDEPVIEKISGPLEDLEVDEPETKEEVPEGTLNEVESRSVSHEIVGGAEEHELEQSEPVETVPEAIEERHVEEDIIPPTEEPIEVAIVIICKADFRSNGNSVTPNISMRQLTNLLLK
jgi:hypothetical protein